MNRRKRAGMTGIKRLQQIERFTAPHLAQNNAIWPVPECGPKEITNSDRALVGPLSSCLKLYQVLKGDLNLGRVFDQHYPFFRIDERGQCIEHRGFSASGTARDKYVFVLPDRLSEMVHDRLRNRADAYQFFRRKTSRLKLTNGQRRFLGVSMAGWRQQRENRPAGVHRAVASRH